MIHVKKFIDSVHNAKTAGQRQIVLDIKQAELISYDLSKMLAEYIELQQQNVNLKKDADNTQVEMDGGEW